MAEAIGARQASFINPALQDFFQFCQE